MEGKNGGYLFGGDKEPNTMVDTAAGKVIEDQKRAAEAAAGLSKEKLAGQPETAPGVVVDKAHLQAIADHEKSAAHAAQIKEAQALAERAAENQKQTDYKNRLVREHQKGDGKYFAILRDINTGVTKGTAEQQDDLARLKKFKEVGTDNAVDQGSLGELVAVEVVFSRQASQLPEATKPPGAWQRLKGILGVK